MTNLERKSQHSSTLFLSLPEHLRLFSAAQVAVILQVDKIGVRRLVREGKLEGKRIGAQIRISQTAIEKYLERVEAQARR